MLRIIVAHLAQQKLDDGSVLLRIPTRLQVRIWNMMMIMMKGPLRGAFILAKASVIAFVCLSCLLVSGDQSENL